MPTDKWAAAVHAGQATGPKQLATDTGQQRHRVTPDEHTWLNHSSSIRGTSSAALAAGADVPALLTGGYRASVEIGRHLFVNGAFYPDWSLDERRGDRSE